MTTEEWKVESTQADMQNNKNLPAETGLALMQVNETCAFSSAEKSNRNPAEAVRKVRMQNSLVSYHCNLSLKIYFIQARLWETGPRNNSSQ